MQIGNFTREGQYLIGRIGDLTLSWDRHRGGRLGIARQVAGEFVQVGHFALEARLEGAVLYSSADPDPRLITVEAGPHRLALRAVQRLYDADGIHLGDAMQETWAWADGSLYLNGMLRVIYPQRGGRLLEAGAHLVFADGWAAGTGEGIQLAHTSGGQLAVLCCGDGGDWALPANEGGAVDESAWETLVSSQPPFYRYWGPYYDQWGGTAGWTRLALEEGPALRAVWAEAERRERGSIEAFKGTLALLGASDEAVLAQKVRAFARPLEPTVEGGQVLYHAPMEGTTVVRKHSERLVVRFPADPDRRQVRLQVRVPGQRRPLAISGDGAVGFPLAPGGVADDPNGPNLLRPDDRHGPILTDGDLRPEEVLTTVDLVADREATVELAPAPGLWMAGQKWDDRQNLLLFSSAHPQGNVGALSLRDLKLRDLKIPGFTEVVMARLPLYWFEANANSAHHCLNQPLSVELIENGPAALSFRVVGQNPAGTAQSDIEVRMPFLEDQLRFDMVCRFEALEDWDLNGIQYCNFFPEERRYPEDWGSDRVLVMAADGQWTRTDHRAGGESRVSAGAKFQDYEGALFVALYGGPRGSILALSRPRQIGQARLGYQLCACWLDNHLFVSAEAALPAGTRYEVELSLVLAQTSSADEDLEALGQRALEAGDIVL